MLEMSPDGRVGEGSEWEPWSEHGMGLMGRAGSCGAGSGASGGGQAPGALPGRWRGVPLSLMDKARKGYTDLAVAGDSQIWNPVFSELVGCYHLSGSPRPL